MKNRKAALELSVSTIVVIVLGVTMLIIGMVLVRNIMCGAIGLTGDINTKVQGQITALFGASEGEVQCIGAGGEAVQMTPGKINTVWCGINAPRAADYKIELQEISDSPTGVLPARVRSSWVKTTEWSGRVSPGDKSPQKVVRLDVPTDAPEGLLIMKFIISRKDEGASSYQQISTQSLDFEVKRAGLVRTSVC